MSKNESAVVIGGGGHVGLPLSIVLAESGIPTIAYDVSDEAVRYIERGEMPFMEKGAQESLSKVVDSGMLRATTNPLCIRNAKFIFVVIGTPVDEHLSPDPNSVITTIGEIAEYLTNDHVLMLRSTIFPGVTKKITIELRTKLPGISIAYCPERIIEGEALIEIAKLPQIIGAYDNKSLVDATLLFSKMGVEVIESSPEEAELAKLFTNVWRYVKFAAANQFWMISNDLNVDYSQVRKLMSYKYPRASDIPKSGFTAGPCLFKDTMQLSAVVQQMFPLGHSAMMINEGMPGYLVSRLKSTYDLAEMTVGILGMSFKANVDDKRSSLAYKLRKLLLFSAKNVVITDPFVKDDRIISLEETIEQSDILIVGAPHDQYLDLATNIPIIDVWGMLKNGIMI